MLVCQSPSVWSIIVAKKLSHEKEIQKNVYSQAFGITLGIILVVAFFLDIAVSAKPLNFPD